MKGDKLVNYALDSTLEGEGQWTHNKTTVVTSDNTSKEAAASTTSNTLKDFVKKAAKTLIHHQHQTQYWKHIKNLAVQQDVFHICALPTKDNLYKCGKIISETCDLCGDPETIAHVLSGCKLMLDQGRYTWPHDSTLNKITEFVNQVNDSDLISNADLGEKWWTIPPDLLVTSDRPDLVVIDNIKKCISILELIVLFENNLNRN